MKLPSRPKPNPGGTSGATSATTTGIVRSAGARGVSLDQQLIALLHANPRAFIDGNVNLVKAGFPVQVFDLAPAALEAASEDQRKAFRAHPAVKLRIAELRAAKAAEALAKSTAAPLPSLQ